MKCVSLIVDDKGSIGFLNRRNCGLKFFLKFCNRQHIFATEIRLFVDSTVCKNIVRTFILQRLLDCLLRSLHQLIKCEATLIAFGFVIKLKLLHNNTSRKVSFKLVLFVNPCGRHHKDSVWFVFFQCAFQLFQIARSVEFTFHAVSPFKPIDSRSN